MEKKLIKTVGHIELCPTEIFIIIFKYLNAHDLLACRGVNKTWRHIADYCGQYHNKWSTLLRDCMHNRGVTFQQRSNLPYRDLYLNYCMWKFVLKAQAELIHTYDLKEAHKLHVYKDTLIVVCKNSVKFFNLESGKIIKEISDAYLDYQETDFLIVKITLKEGRKHMSLYSKQHCKTYESLGFRIYSVQLNKCYLTNERNCIVLYESTPNAFTEVKLSRFYSNPNLLCAMFMYMDEMYIYITKGDVYRHKRGEFGLKQVCESGAPIVPGILTNNQSDFKTMFHKYSVVYAVDCKEKEMVFRKTSESNLNEQLVLLYADLTCATEHGDIILLGFRDGKVGIVIVSRLWATGDLCPVFEFYIQDVAQVQDVEPIRALEVYEADGCHHIVAVTTKVYQVVISHADYKKVMP